MTEDDQALSRLAAKAAGIVVGKFQGLLSSMPDDYIDGGFMVGEVHPAFGFRGYYWNPLDHDGDALRLAGKLCMNIEITDSYVFACSVGNFSEPAKPDREAAVRRAIVRAAAALESGGDTV